ncbi:MAG: hypothetical protein ACO1SV_25195 [Fimbriimonas sp.]
MVDSARIAKPVAAALAVGAVAGAILVAARAPRYGFLPEAHQTSLKENILGSGLRSTVSRYVASESADRVLDRLRDESPLRIERRTKVEGQPGWVVTVPRTVENRADLAFPPAREITVLDGSPSTVVVREYRSPGALDAFVEWVRRPLKAG